MVWYLTDVVAVIFCSSQRSRQVQQHDAPDAEKARAAVNSREAPSDEVKKSVRRNRELERLGVVQPVQQASNSKQQSAVKKSASKKAKVVSNSHPRTSEDNESSASVADVDDDSTSDTDVDQSSVSEEDVLDDDESEEAVSDTDNEVIIVSEVKGKKSDDSRLKMADEKSGNDRGSGSKVDTGGSVSSKKSRTQVAVDESLSSSRWLHRVNMLETTMSEMKAKFAEVLRHKVSDLCIHCTLQ